MVCSSGDLDSRKPSLPSLAAAGVLEYRCFKRWKVFENFVRDQMGATAQGQLDKSTYESLAGSMVPRHEDFKVPKKSLVKALTGEAKAAKMKRDEMTTQLRSTSAMITKVTALEKTKSPVEARLRLKPGYGEVMAEQLRTSNKNLEERSAALCALWTSATVALKSGKDIDCEKLSRKTQELETTLQAFEVVIFADTPSIQWAPQENVGPIQRWETGPPKSASQHGALGVLRALACTLSNRDDAITLGA